MLLPLLAFDRAGNRIGYGGGYYDRTLHFLQKPSAMPPKPSLLGVGYTFQEVPAIDRDPWDIPLVGMVTEEGTMSCSTSGA